MFYSDDPVSDWDRYCRYQDRLRQEEILQEIRQLEYKLEDDDMFQEEFEEYKWNIDEEITEDEFFKIYEKRIQDEIDELNEEYENCQW